MENDNMTKAELIVFLKTIAENIRLKAKDGNDQGTQSTRIMKRALRVQVATSSGEPEPN